jgi:HTH-type transcriptional regulator/antitoxin HigA
MIRNLSVSLGISADVLIQDPVQKVAIEKNVSGSRYPLKEMLDGGYFESFKGKLAEVKEYADEHVSEFFSSLAGGHDLRPAMLKTTAHKRSNDKVINEYALAAWQAKVLKEFVAEDLNTEYEKGVVTEEWMVRLAQLSWSDKGPLLAKEYLNKSGIGLIVERHLPGTYLDGAVCVSEGGNPVVALTLRYDKLDSFWFTLMHELAHLALHIEDDGSWFLDNLDMEGGDDLERQADDLAQDSLIPKKEWEQFVNHNADAVRDFAKRLSISPSIIAGRMRYEKENHTLYGTLFRDKVRLHFM